MGQGSKLPELAMKDTKGKLAYSLLPPEALAMAVRGFAAGLQDGHHTKNDWRRGAPWMCWYDAMMRHLELWRAGEDIDPTDGKHHLEGVLASVMILAAHIASNLGTDDRNEVL